MKIFILFILVFAVACGENQKANNSNLANSVNTTNSDPTAQIEASVKEYFSKPQPSAYTNTVYPPAKVFGVTIDQKIEEVYVVGADIQKSDGKRTTQQVIVRKYTGNGQTYWKTEPYNYMYLESLKENKELK